MDDLLKMYKIEDIKNTIIQGDCLLELKKFPDNSIDTIITDPPYGLEFMGKDFDTFRYKWKKFKDVPDEWIKEYENKKNL